MIEKEFMVLRVGPKPQKCNVSNHGVAHNKMVSFKAVCIMLIPPKGRLQDEMSRLHIYSVVFSLGKDTGQASSKISAWVSLKIPP